MLDPPETAATLAETYTGRSRSHLKGTGARGMLAGRCGNETWPLGLHVHDGFHTASFDIGEPDPKVAEAGVPDAADDWWAMPCRRQVPVDSREQRIPTAKSLSWQGRILVKLSVTIPQNLK